MVTVIQKSRNGFLFQDLYCLNIILGLLLNQELKSFRVDYTFDESANRSVDLKIIDRSDAVSIYEIKTGDSYKKNKDDCIIESICTLYLYSLKEASTNLRIYIVLDKSEGHIVSDYFSYFHESNFRANKKLLGNTTVGKKTDEIMQKMLEYKKNPQSRQKYLGDNPNTKAIKLFLKAVKPKPFDGLLEKIIEENLTYIRQISEKLSLQEIPSHGVSDNGILYELLFCLQRTVGDETINEINEAFYKPFIDNFCRRSLTSLAPTIAGSTDSLKKLKINEIKGLLRSNLGLIEQQAEVSVVQVQEGGPAL